jgi:probable phosphoglycerate mutase
MTRLHLIRHATTAETGTRLTGRLPGVGLDPNGRDQAAATASSLADVRLGAVYCSPPRRCRETAKAIASHYGLDPVPYRSLIEVDYGAWSGRTLRSLQRTKAWRQLFVAPSRVTFPGGESLLAVQARAVAACEELASTHGTGTIALVSHGDVIKSIMAHYLGTPLDLFQRIVIDPASVSIVDLPAEGAPQVLALNRTSS